MSERDASTQPREYRGGLRVAALETRMERMEQEKAEKETSAGAELRSAGAPIASSPLDTRELRKRRREWFAIGLLVASFLALTAGEFRLTKISSALPFTNSIVFFALLNINIVILVAIAWLVFRNIGKLFIERRRKILGARLKTKLVLSFLAFSVIPTLVLFLISALYINSSFEKWFSIKIQNTLQASLEITDTYYRNASQSAMHFAEHIAKGIAARLGQESSGPSESQDLETPVWVASFLEAQRGLLSLDSVEFYQDPLDARLGAARGMELEEPVPRLSLDNLDRAFAGERVSLFQHVGTGDLIRCVVPVHALGAARREIAGVVAVSTYIPFSLVNKVDEIASVVDDYKDINPLKYPMKTTYFIILVMITLVIIFVAIWMGLFMARELTVPVERLVYAAQAVGAGNLDVSISGAGHDEIAVLVESFNKMTSDLRENRARLFEATADLERRRLQLEAILANIGTGVISVDRAGSITTINHAATQLLEIDPGASVGKRFGEVLAGEMAPLRDLIDRAFLLARVEEPASPESAQWSFVGKAGPRSLSAIATPLKEADAELARGLRIERRPEGESGHWGVVVVVDDTTHLVKAQREMAWREVARRIAHEIKNPLTPIKLSAQRLQRRLGQYSGKEGVLLRECTETIIRHTDELKEMVNEFSSFARFPEVSPAPNSLNDAIREVVALFSQAHGDWVFRMDLEPRLPIFEFDRDQIKRVVINLLDNAVAAGGLKVRVATHFNDLLRIAAVEVEDNGPGMPEDVRERIFEPYFSTKKEGTGLGLAIAKRIVNDHDGFIRVSSSPGKGTLFLVELPTSPKAKLSIAAPGTELA